MNYRRGSNKTGAGLVRRVLALFFCALLTGMLAAPLLELAVPEKSTSAAHAAEAGGDLEIRVGYFGDDQNYRTKAVLKRADLERLAQDQGGVIYQYSNVTRVGTVMGTIARGPTVISILEAAGIDPGSVQTINLRTTDREGTANNWFVSLNMDQWVNSTRWYYPFLRSDYERQEYEDGYQDPEEGMAEGMVVPGSNALRAAKTVPAILAIQSYSTKDPDEAIDETMMNEEVSYRFCAGQTKMKAGVPCGEYTSMNSAQWVFGIDVTLYGSPAEASDLELSLDDSNLVVGSRKQIGFQIYGQDLFEDLVNTDLTWTSSNPKIARVDKNGVVTILKAGKVTITATTSNGISKSVTINAADKKSKKKKPKEKKPQEKQPQKKQPQEKKENTQTTPQKKVNQAQQRILHNQRKAEEQEKAEEKQREQSAQAGQSGQKKMGAGMREIILEGDITDHEEINENTTPLDARRRTPVAGAVAVAGAGIFAGAGGVLRFLGYLKEVL